MEISIVLQLSEFGLILHGLWIPVITTNTNTHGHILVGHTATIVDFAGMEMREASLATRVVVISKYSIIE